MLPHPFGLNILQILTVESLIQIEKPPLTFL
jgi:hypothetical protein